MLSPTYEPGTTISVQRRMTSGCVVPATENRIWVATGAPRPAPQPEAGRLSLYAPDFFLRSQTPWLIYDESENLLASDLIADLEAVAEPIPAPAWTASPYSDFETAFEDVQSRITNGTLIKAVPFIERRAKIELTPNRRAVILLNALRRCQGQNLKPYGFWNEREGMIGTTPETLFQQKPYLSTMALAGTRPLNGSSLLEDPKEMTEHRIVVEGMVEQLAPLGRVIVGATNELELPTLAHLYTPIEVIPNRAVAFDEWVAALHPTAAIGAWPKAEGWQWLQSQPNAGERGRYGAPFGFIPPDRETGTCLVAIRNVQWTDDQVKLLAGGGIVAASQIDREWREFNAKLDSIQEALGLGR